MNTMSAGRQKSSNVVGLSTGRKRLQNSVADVINTLEVEDDGDDIQEDILNASTKTNEQTQAQKSSGWSVDRRTVIIILACICIVLLVSVILYTYFYKHSAEDADKLGDPGMYGGRGHNMSGMNGGMMGGVQGMNGGMMGPPSIAQIRARQQMGQYSNQQGYYDAQGQGYSSGYPQGHQQGPQGQNISNQNTSNQQRYVNVQKENREHEQDRDGLVGCEDPSQDSCKVSPTGSSKRTVTFADETDRRNNVQANSLNTSNTNPNTNAKVTTTVAKQPTTQTNQSAKLDIDDILARSADAQAELQKEQDTEELVDSKDDKDNTDDKDAKQNDDADDSKELEELMRRQDGR